MERGTGAEPAWERLLGDLAGQLAAAGRAEQRAEVAERSAALQAAALLADAVRGARGGEVVLQLRGDAAPWAARLVDSGPDWLLAERGGRETLAPMAALTWWQGPRSPRPPVGAVEGRYGLPLALRAVARSGGAVRVRAGGRAVVGLLGRIGADHVEVVERADAEAGAALRGWVVPFAALEVVERL
jgi:hypothetical protein